MKSAALVLLPLLVTACSSPQPYATSVGILQPGSTMTVRSDNGAVNVYKPAVGEPSNRFTIAAYAPPNTTLAAPRTFPLHNGVTVDAPSGISSLLVRVPTGVDLSVDAKSGDVSVTDITGNVVVHDGTGNVKIMVPGYAQAALGKGKLDVTIGSGTWPGTLTISNGDGDIDLYVIATAKFRVHMHTDNGTLFSDFALRGQSNGNSETIDGIVNGGGTQAIDVHSGHGIVRLLRLSPQA